MITPCTILDLGAMVPQVDKTMGVDTFMYVRQSLAGPDKWFQIGSIVLQFQLIGDHKVNLHMYGENDVSLETLRNFIVLAGAWMMDNTATTCILCYCKISDRKLRFLLRACGGPDPLTIPNGDGEDDELLYIFSKKDRIRYERRVTCHKQ